MLTFLTVFYIKNECLEVFFKFETIDGKIVDSKI